MPAALPRPLLTVDQAAERLNVTPRYVRRLAQERRVRSVKVGHFLRFDPADIDALLVAGTREAVAL